MRNDGGAPTTNRGTGGGKRPFLQSALTMTSRCARNAVEEMKLPRQRIKFPPSVPYEVQGVERRVGEQPRGVDSVGEIQQRPGVGAVGIRTSYPVQTRVLRPRLTVENPQCQLSRGWVRTIRLTSLVAPFQVLPPLCNCVRVTVSRIMTGPRRCLRRRAWSQRLGTEGGCVMYPE